MEVQVCWEGAVAEPAVYRPEGFKPTEDYLCFRWDSEHYLFFDHEAKVVMFHVGTQTVMDCNSRKPEYPGENWGTHVLFVCMGKFIQRYDGDKLSPLVFKHGLLFTFQGQEWSILDFKHVSNDCPAFPMNKEKLIFFEPNTRLCQLDLYTGDQVELSSSSGLGTGVQYGPLVVSGRVYYIDNQMTLCCFAPNKKQRGWVWVEIQALEHVDETCGGCAMSSRDPLLFLYTPRQLIQYHTITGVRVDIRLPVVLESEPLLLGYQFHMEGLDDSNMLTIYGYEPTKKLEVYTIGPIVTTPTPLAIPPLKDSRWKMHVSKKNLSFCCTDGRVLANTFMLESTGSIVFHQLLKGRMKGGTNEDEDGVLEIPCGFTTETMQSLVNLIYTNEIHLPVKELIQVMQAADYYQLSDCLDICTLVILKLSPVELGEGYAQADELVDVVCFQRLKTLILSKVLSGNRLMMNRFWRGLSGELLMEASRFCRYFG